VDMAVFSFWEAMRIIFGLSGVLFAVLMIMSNHHGNKFHKM
jgi:hypothetical protein